MNFKVFIFAIRVYVCLRGQKKKAVAKGKGRVASLALLQHSDVPPKRCPCCYINRKGKGRPFGGQESTSADA